MTEDDYKKLSAGEKKGLDTILRRTTLTIMDVDNVATAEPKASGPKSIDINMNVRLKRDMKKTESNAVGGGPELFDATA